MSVGGARPGRLERLLHDEAAPGLVLMGVVAVALGLANSAWAPAYHDLFHHRLGWSPVARLPTLHAWINDAVMALFFFVVGLEIKREMVTGALSHPATRRMPVIAAAAGMAAPAAVFLLVTQGQAHLTRGWAIPAATDIAFALGVVALLARRVPPALRLFLLTVAIVDDIGAVAIIALAYTAMIDVGWLGAAALALAALAGLNRLGVRRGWAYGLLALALWYAVLHSGVHATVAGVLAALTVPVRLDRRGDSLLVRMEHALVPWTGFVVVPLFALANAGVRLEGATGQGAMAPLPLAIALGLIVGKQGGIMASLFVAERLGFGGRPSGATWAQVWGMATLCGIGFTMSLFIAALAFPAQPELVEQAKLGILCASLISALAGYAILRLCAAPAT